MITHTTDLRILDNYGEPKLNVHEAFKCENCDKLHSEDSLKAVKDFHMRVLPEELVPGGECPDCGCLCHAIGT